MRTAFCRKFRVFGLISLLAACHGAERVREAQGVPSPPAVEAARSGAAISVATGGSRVDIPVDLQGVETDPGRGRSVELLRRTASYLVVIDSWGSAPQAMSRCGAGQERFVRILSVTSLRETYAYLVESCLRDVVPAEPLFEWTGTGMKLHILSGAPSISLSIAQNGDVVLQ